MLKIQCEILNIKWLPQKCNGCQHQFMYMCKNCTNSFSVFPVYVLAVNTPYLCEISITKSMVPNQWCQNLLTSGAHNYVVILNL